MDILQNKPLVYGSAIALAAVGIGWNSLNQPSGTGPGDIARQVRIETQKQQAALQGSLELEKLNKEVAESRFNDGCTLVVGLETPDRYVSLGQSPVLDPTNKQPLPAGTVVCDANGNTGILDADGVPKLLAQTADRTVIEKQKQMDKAAGIQPALQTIPSQGGKNDRATTR